jgi:hypothetical protein
MAAPPPAPPPLLAMPLALPLALPREEDDDASAVMRPTAVKAAQKRR